MQHPELSPSEWRAVSIALADADRIGCPAGNSGLFGRLYSAMTGNRPATPLADPRLEAVRRFVCDTHRQRRLSQAYAPALAEHGFNGRQIEALAMLAA